MHWRIEVTTKPELVDARGQGIEADIKDLGITSVGKVRVVRVYLLTAPLTEEEIDRICKELLADPVTEVYSVNRPPSGAEGPLRSVQVFRKPGVMDPVEASTLKGLRDMDLNADSIRTGVKYLLCGSAASEEIELIGRRILYNPAIEELFPGDAEVPHAPESPEYHFQIRTVPLREADDQTLQRISREWVLSLNLAEMKTIQKYYSELGRDPTDVELETLAQTWSEHCVHKTFRGLIEYEGEEIDSLLGSTIALATKELAKPWCVSVFEDNAGIIRFDDRYNICFKVETHNHPSAIEPYGGAGTGIGGVIRDPLGTGLGAKPILNTDIFCFGPPDLSDDKVPPGTLHPKRIMKGVIAGVRDYGNRMGIPTANGAVLFDERYTANPLVYCGNVGLIPRDKCRKEARAGDLIVVVGGRTGRDGIHGVTFASVELTEESEVVSGGAVQIGNAITEKRMTDTLLQARDRGLYTCITDCGGGGLSSAVGEMGEELGGAVDLEKVPLKYEGLSYREIWISEAQERMVIAVPPENVDEIMSIFEAEDVEATVIGRFTGDSRLRLSYEGDQVCDLDMRFLHKGLPRLRRKATWSAPKNPEPELPEKDDYGEDLKGILSAWNVCSKEWVIRQYDHEVQGASVLKPLVGAHNDGPGDACVIAPVLGSRLGLAVANGINPRYGDIDPYHMAASAIDEAIRQIVAVGGDPERIALLDNFCWGNTDRPELLGGLVRAARACYDVATAYGTPFISGKDSLNNEYRVGDRTIIIPSTLLISAIGIVPDVTSVVSMDAKREGDLLYAVGLTRNELGGSHYYMLHGAVGNSVPKVRTDEGLRTFKAMAEAIEGGLVRACHDCSEGGIAVAAAEMAFAGELGVAIRAGDIPCDEEVRRADFAIFSESNSRFLVEVAPDDHEAFERTMAEVPHNVIGEFNGTSRMVVGNSADKIIVDEDIRDLKEAWQKPLRW